MRSYISYDELEELGETIVRAYINGIVITQSVCEIIAIDAPVSELPPYASGKTTVFNPKGVATAKNSNINGVLSILRWNIIFTNSFTPNRIANVKIGIIISLNAVARYTFLFFNNALKS